MVNGFHWIFFTVTNGTVGLANRRTRRPLVNYGSNEISMDQRRRSHSPAATSSSSDLSDEEEVDNSKDEDSSDTDYIDDSPQVDIKKVAVEMGPDPAQTYWARARAWAWTWAWAGPKAQAHFYGY